MRRSVSRFTCVQLAQVFSCFFYSLLGNAGVRVCSCCSSFGQLVRLLILFRFLFTAVPARFALTFELRKGRRQDGSARRVRRKKCSMSGITNKEKGRETKRQKRGEVGDNGRSQKKPREGSKKKAKKEMGGGDEEWSRWERRKKQVTRPDPGTAGDGNEQAQRGRERGRERWKKETSGGTSGHDKNTTGRVGQARERGERQQVTPNHKKETRKAPTHNHPEGKADDAAQASSKGNGGRKKQKERRTCIM